MDTNAIKDVIQTYFDACYENSREKMKKVFHDPAHVYVRAEDGALKDWDKTTFVGFFSDSATEEPKPSYPRSDKILSLDFIGEEAAVARVELRIRDTAYTDILCFMLLDGKWGVISKVYTEKPAE